MVIATVRLRTARATVLWKLFSLPLLFIAGCSDSTGPEPWERGDLLDRLNGLPGVTAAEIQPYYGYPRAFQLDITQPVDHLNPTGPQFTQRAYLSHVADSLPMVFAPSGYGTSPQSGQELAGILQANCLSVTHRYFPDARPANLDWQYLDIRQAAEDHHRIVTLLNRIYSGTWVSTGISKGGETVLFHRRFYPDDVQATVAYVAPLLFSDEDPRFMPYLRGLGSPEVRDGITAFQRMLLEKKPDLLDDFQEWFERNDLAFSLPVAPSFESAVISYPWNFWQRKAFELSEIPGLEASETEMVDHLAAVTRMHFDADLYRDYFRAYVYQGLTEIGMPSIGYDEIQDLIVEDPLEVNESYGFPQDLEFTYRFESIPDVLSWLQQHGDRIIYIYGEVDPWTAGAVELPGSIDALKIIQPDADHGVRMIDLDQTALVSETLSRWLGREVQVGVTAPHLGTPLRIPAGAELFGTLDQVTLDPGRTGIR
ncbi:MAG: hypothetical protein HKO65_09095 [Gemmatimonadetes bacterium]|nr:hypothetical protein [Gemmatimonadota bacterium]NNM05245.1 hypothetical protein [Gemmatimonadota bacterium]